ncbi:MAG: hypothetical protein WAV28_14920 [Sedimentisphaerales bacterium]|jgi:exonuclease VII large subunit
MRGVINNIIDFYQIQSEALNVLVTNTQKALEQSEKERKANQQMQRLENFVKELTMDLNNMLTKFYWLKERKKRRYEEMKPDQVNAMVDFAHCVKSLTKKVQPMLEYFRKGPTFAEKVDKDIEELEAYIKAQLKKFNEILDETPDTLAIRLSKYAKALSGRVWKIFTNGGFSILKSNQVTPSKRSEEQLYGDKDGISAFVASPPDEELENLVYGLDITSAQKSNNKSKRYTYSKI